MIAENRFDDLAVLMKAGTRSHIAFVDGDSMAPKYKDGDVVFFSAGLPAEIGDDVMLTITSGESYFGRISSMPKGKIKLEHLNKQYNDMIFESLAVKEVLKLVLAIHRKKRRA